MVPLMHNLPRVLAANPSGQTAYTDHSILAVLATGLSTLNGTTLERAEELCRIMVSRRVIEDDEVSSSCRDTPDRYRLVHSIDDTQIYIPPTRAFHARLQVSLKHLYSYVITRV